jgi:hypothetical protein
VWQKRGENKIEGNMIYLLMPLVVMGVYVFACIHAAHGHFIYSLDDPYIHLALARGIADGFYGINPGEWSSPSSSIAWPLMLSLFVGRFFEQAPLLINGVCLLAAFRIWALFFESAQIGKLIASLLALALCLGLNYFGLLMTGMEHSLQVLLVLVVAWKVIERKWDAWLFIALALAPMVRYECAAISMPVLIYLWFTGERSRSLMTALAVVAVMVGFSVFLHLHGLPLLPCSILAKTSKLNLTGNWRGQPALVFMVAWTSFCLYKTQGLKEALLLVALPYFLFLFLGQSGWLARYEVFIVSYLAMFFLSSLRAESRLKMGLTFGQDIRGNAGGFLASVGVLTALSFPNLAAYTLYTPRSCSNIQEQQALMARIAAQLQAPVAVHDLGLMALRSGQPILDLWGLGSYEALQARLNPGSGPDWVQNIMQRHHVQFAFVSDEWFNNRLPASFVRVGSLSLQGATVLVSKRVSLFAIGQENSNKLRDILTKLKSDPEVSGLIAIN